MADDPLYVCGDCGKITQGPQENQFIPHWNKERGYSDDDPTPQGQPASYHGRPISHSTCDDCTNKALEETRRKHAQKDHIWFRKPGSSSGRTEGGGR